jgi:LPPG:FO 2-phospho-L-lactate transferase
MVTVLAGGIGAAKFLEGLAGVMPPEEITVIVNTGDDDAFHGLHISPDIDTVLYTLAGVVNRETGWGLAGETFHCLGALGRFAEDTWFQLGDRDLATHLFRTRRLREGASLSEVTLELAGAFRVHSKLLPMTDGPAMTMLETSAGRLPFQEYFVKLRQQPEVRAVDLTAAERSQPAPGVLDALMNSRGIIIAPSNPIISIGPILAVRGIRDALHNTPAPVAAISPIVGGKALKGPADRMLASLGYGASAAAVAGLYHDIADVLVLDQQDAALRAEVESQGMKAVVTQTVMTSNDVKQGLARTVLHCLLKN